MARLLRDLDYLRLIQSDNLAQVIQGNSQITLDVEMSAQSEMISYLAQRYIISEVFTDTTVFDSCAIYRAKNLVEYTAAAFSATLNYQQGDIVLQAGNIYCANTDITASAFDATEWTFLCTDRTLFFVKLPQPEFSYTTTYAIGDKVWYADKVYTCLVACVNIAPTESAFWGTGVDYYVTATEPTDTNLWTQGDNRNQQIVLFLIDIVLYHLHSRINPRNIPDLRKERYNGNSPTDSGGAIGWLKSVAKGNVQADLPNIIPQQGMSIRYGSAGTYNNPSPNMLW